MRPAFMALLGAGFTCAGCYASGAVLIDRLQLKLRGPERFPLALVLGGACLHLAVFAILALQIAYWPVLVALLLAVIGFAVRCGSWRVSGERSEPLSTTLRTLCVLLFGAFTLIYFLHAWAPEISPDGSAYHLGFVARYLRSHGFERITTSMYAVLGGGVEMLFVPAFAIGKHSAAALTHLAFLIALALSIVAYGRRLGKPWAGVVGAFLVYASPVAGIDGSSAYIDAAAAAIVFSVFYWLEIWDELRDERILIPIGLLAGFAYAAKYTIFAIALYAIGFLLWRTRSMRPVLKMLGWASLTMTPWVLKNWIVLHNPVAPFANQLFRNPYFHAGVIDEWSAYLRSYGLPNLKALPLEVTVRGAVTQGLIGPVFLVLPIALLSLRFRAGRRLMAAGVILLVPYFGNIGTRFLIPVLPFFGLALALAPGDSPGLVTVLMLFSALTSWPSVIKHYAEPGSWRMDTVPLKRGIQTALRIIPEDTFLRQASLSYSIARMVDDYVPRNEPVLGLTAIADAYTRREILVDYEAAFNNLLADVLNNGWVASYQPRVLESYTFRERGVRRIRIEQTSLGRLREQWSLHEIRFFHAGTELPRRPEWRLNAWPDPWDVQLAFDNSPATRWRTWERAAPGQYVQVDFGGEVAIGEVRIERSYDYNELKVAVKTLDSGTGSWTVIAREPKVTAIKPDPNIRRYATRELKERGVRFVLVPDDYSGAFDFRGDPEGWGMELVTAGYGARLYRIL
jgi:hypothetical protein